MRKELKCKCALHYAGDGPYLRMRKLYKRMHLGQRGVHWPARPEVARPSSSHMLLACSLNLDPALPHCVRIPEMHVLQREGRYMIVCCQYFRLEFPVVAKVKVKLILCETLL